MTIFVDTYLQEVVTSQIYVVVSVFHVQGKLISCPREFDYLVLVIRKKKATNKELHLLFIDFTKAYDSVPLNKLWETLDRSTINTRSIEAIKSLYKGLCSKIKA
jgi:hypothetical protein